MSEENQVETWKEHLGKETEEVEVPFKLKKEKHGWVDIEYGLNDEGDYVWHFSTHHPRRIFPPHMDKVRRIIVTYLSKTIPEDVQVDYFPSPSDWEKKVETVIAKGFGKKWNFDEEDANKTLPKILEMLNEEIEEYAKINRRKGL